MRQHIHRALRKAQRVADQRIPMPEDRPHLEWVAANGDIRLLLDHDLDAESVVIDVGGYMGRWASDIFARYLCTVHVLEPVAEFADIAAWRFEHNPKVTVHACGIGPERRTLRLGGEDDATSSHSRGKVTGQIVPAEEFFAEIGEPTADLMSMNIEGDEYELIGHLIDTGRIQRIRNLQVQFHDVVPDAERRVAALRERLSATHTPTYRFPFVWEGWRRHGG